MFSVFFVFKVGLIFQSTEKFVNKPKTKKNCGNKQSFPPLIQDFFCLFYDFFSVNCFISHEVTCHFRLIATSVYCYSGLLRAHQKRNAFKAARDQFAFLSSPLPIVNCYTTWGTFVCVIRWLWSRIPSLSFQENVVMKKRILSFLKFDIY